MKKVLSLILLFCLTVSLCTLASADGIKKIFEGEQEFLILGTVKDVTEDVVVVTVDNTVGEKSPSIVGEDVNILKFSYSYCEDHAPKSFNNPKIGDNIFVSASLEEENYKVVNGAYRVDSSEIKNCSTLVHQNMRGQDCLEDAVKLAYFVRTNGKITEFKKGSDDKIYAVTDTDEVLVYPLPGNQCIKFVDNNDQILDETTQDDVIPIVPEPATEKDADSNKWIFAVSIFAGGAILGFLAMLFYYTRKKL